MNLFKHPHFMKLVSLIVAVIGLVFILNSPKWGSQSALSWLQSLGSANTDDYRQMKSGYMNAYLTVGGILLFAGLHSLLNSKK